MQKMKERVKQALLLGREHYRRGDYERAEYFLRKVADGEDRYADVFDQLGVIAYGRGHYDRAATCFQRAVQLNENYTEARINLAVTYNELGRYEEAQQVCSELSDEGKPPGPDAFQRGRIANLHAQTAQAYQDAGQLEAAIGELEKAVELRPGFADLRLWLARLLGKAGQRSRAEQAYRSLLHDKPDYVEAYLQLSAALLASERPEDALEVLVRLQGIAPESPRARLYERRARAALGEGQRA